MNEHPRNLHRDNSGRGAEGDIRRRNSHFARLRLLGRVDGRLGEAFREAKRFTLRLDFNELLATILLMIVSMGIILLTYAGVSMPLSESGEGLIGKGHALSFSITVGVLSWLGWQFIFSIVPKLHRKRLVAGMLAGAFYALSITAIDAPFSVLALGGPTSVKLSLVDTSHYYEDVTTALYERTTKSAQLVPFLRTQHQRFLSLAEIEVATGAQSGRKGEGKVSLAFGQIATIVGTLADQIDEGITRSKSIQAQVVAAVAEMKSHVFVAGDIAERSQAVSIAADKVDQLLGELRQFDYTASIEASLAVLDQLIPEQGNARSDFEATQNAELAIIGEMAKPVAAALREALANSDRELLWDRAMRPLDAMEAIRVYWWPLLPQWIASIFLDIAPLGLLIMLLAGRREVTHLSNDNHGDRK